MKYINIVLDYLLFVILGVMSFTMAINVLCRFCLNFSIYWADELTQSLMLWLTFLGAAVAIREHLHYSFNYIEQVNYKQEYYFGWYLYLVFLECRSDRRYCGLDYACYGV